VKTLNAPLWGVLNKLNRWLIDDKKSAYKKILPLLIISILIAVYLFLINSSESKYIIAVSLVSTMIFSGICCFTFSQAQLSSMYRRKLNSVLDVTAEAIYGVDLQGNCTFANSSCIEVLGYKSETDLIGKNIDNYYLGNDYFDTLY